MTRHTYAQALQDLLEGDEIAGVAARLEVSERTVRSWLRGERVGPPKTVFALERCLDVAPGTLSRHLGYVPAPTAMVDTAVAAVAELAAEHVAKYTADDAMSPATTSEVERLDLEQAARKVVQLELMRLAIEDYETEHGAFTDAELEAAGQRLRWELERKDRM